MVNYYALNDNWNLNNINVFPSLANTGDLSYLDHGIYVPEKHMDLETIKSEYIMKYSTHQKSNMPHLAYIVGLLD